MKALQVKEAFGYHTNLQAHQTFSPVLNQMEQGAVKKNFPEHLTL